MQLLGILFTLFVTYVIYVLVREVILNNGGLFNRSEKYQNFANPYSWPFDRILQPIHYWLAQFSPSYLPNAYHIPFYPRYPYMGAPNNYMGARDPYMGGGPWFSLTHY